MTWNVYYYNFNAKKIETFNIFDHWKFNEDVQSDLNKCRNREDFARLLKSHLFYYFCSKCEYEVLISPWIGNSREGAIKVDIYDQVMLNFDKFLDYVWTN